MLLLEALQQEGKGGLLRAETPRRAAGRHPADPPSLYVMALSPTPAQLNVRRYESRGAEASMNMCWHQLQRRAGKQDREIRN